jgi:hypothetical protein
MGTCVVGSHLVCRKTIVVPSNVRPVSHARKLDHLGVRDEGVQAHENRQQESMPTIPESLTAQVSTDEGTQSGHEGRAGRRTLAAS